MSAHSQHEDDPGSERVRGRRFDNVRGGLRLELSPFRLLVFAQCPRKYRHIYHDHLWSEHKKPRPDLSLSNSLHLALRTLYRIGGPARHSLAKLHQIYSENWVSKGYIDEAQEREHVAQGLHALEAYYEAERGRSVRSLFAERTLRIPIDGFRVFAKIDRLDLLDGGGHEAVFYKTGPNTIVGDEEEKRISMGIYALLVRAHYRSERIKLTVWDVLGGKAESTFADVEDEAPFREELIRMAAVIANETAFPQRANPLCEWCDFVDVCKVVKPAEPMPRPTPPPPTDTIGLEGTPLY
jgi:putative RecB family exonuclease